MTIRIRKERVGSIGLWEVELPIISVGPTPPFLGVVSLVHGDEPSGLFAIKSLIELIRRNAPLKGTVIIPIANPLAQTRRHRLSLSDEVDLNRCSTGDPEGCLTMRLSNTVFRHLSQCKYVVTLHEFSAPSISMSCLYVGSDQSLFRDAAILASYLETDVVHTVIPETNKLYWSHGLCLEVALMRHGIACVTYEGSSTASDIITLSNKLSEKLYNVLSHDKDRLPFLRPIPFPTSRDLIRSDASGLFEPVPRTRLFANIARDETVGHVYSVPEFARKKCISPKSGFLIQVAPAGMVDTATPIASIGSLDIRTSDSFSRLGLEHIRDIQQRSLDT